MPYVVECTRKLDYLSWKKLRLSRAKLKASSKTSALFSGFAMVAMVELQLEDEVSERLLIAFAIITTLLVSVHILALMISTCILPEMDTISDLDSIDCVHQSPHERFHWYIEMAWIFSTVFGLLLFLLELGIICAVKFEKYQSQTTAPIWLTCAILIPVLIILIAFSVHFYRTLLGLKYRETVGGISELERIKERIEFRDVMKEHNNSSSECGISIV